MSFSVELYGSPHTRSPLVNWFLLERSIPFTQKPPRPSNHPFGQTPFLTDNHGEVEVFESGAILLYLADAYGFASDGSPPRPTSSAADRAKYSKWIVWANAELDKVCFGHGMGGTMLDKPNRALDRLEVILGSESTNPWILGATFTVADVAVGAYLNYVPVFFQNVKPTMRPNIVRYMQRCAERPAFGEAFGEDHQALVLNKCAQWLSKK